MTLPPHPDTSEYEEHREAYNAWKKNRLLVLISMLAETKKSQIKKLLIPEFQRPTDLEDWLDREKSLDELKEICAKLSK